MAVSRSTTEATPISTPRLRLFPAGRRFGRRVSESGPGPIVPANSIAGNALMIVVAIMSFLACITVGAVTLVRDAAYDWQQDVLREVTVQIVPLDGGDIEADTARALAILRETPGIGSATALSTAQNETLLEPWLGDLDMSELPIPRLIVVEVTNASAVDLAAIGERLSAEVAGATLDDHRMWTDRLRSMANVTVLIGFAVLVLVFAAMLLSVVFATRGAMAGNQGIVSVLHFVGAEDGFVAGEFQRHFLILGLKGGLAGAAGAAVLFALLSLAMMTLRSSPEGAQVSALFGSFAVGPTGYFGALGVAFAIAVLTAITSRITVFRYLGEVK